MKAKTTNQSHELRIVECEYPYSPHVYGIFFVDDVEIGKADKAADGWTPYNRRKVFTAKQAAQLMLESKISAAKKEQKRATALLEALSQIKDEQEST